MEGRGRSSGVPPRRVAVGALAPQRLPPAVYRRRRLTVLLVVAALVAAPWWLLSRDGSGAGRSAGQAQVGAAGEAPGPSTCRAAVEALALRDRLALLLMVGVDGSDPAAVDAVFGAPHRPGGVFVRGGTAVFEDGRVRAAVEASVLPSLVAVDDEGGRVQPLDGVLDELPSPSSMAADQSPGEVEAAALRRGEDLRDLGISLVLAPVADLDEAQVIGDRSFGSDPARVASYAGAYARGLRNAGVLPVLKHFPGHGRADADSHVAVATTPPLAELRSTDLLPYRTVLTEEPTGVLVGHLDVPGLTEDGVPASLSTAAVGLLRGGLEFDGLVMTDDLVAMDAVTDRFDVPSAAERAVVAGVDLVLLAHATDVAAVLDRLEDAVVSGRLDDTRVTAALERIMTAASCT